MQNPEMNTEVGSRNWWIKTIIIVFFGTYFVVGVLFYLMRPDLLAHDEWIKGTERIVFTPLGWFFSPIIILCGLIGRLFR